MAAEWGVHPEDILRRKRSILWAARWAAYREQLAKVDEVNRKMSKK